MTPGISHNDQRPNTFTSDNMEKRFYLSDTDKKLGGVCGGLAEYLGIDSLLVRIAFVILFFGYGCGLLAFILLWLLAPKRTDIV